MKTSVLADCRWKEKNETMNRTAIALSVLTARRTRSAVKNPVDSEAGGRNKNRPDPNTPDR
jgi:hypothetical protein